MGNCTVQAREAENKRTPKGYFVVYVGEEVQRFVISMSYLKNPKFQKLLQEAAEVYGYHNQKCIALPCDLTTFRRVVNFKGK